MSSSTAETQLSIGNSGRLESRSAAAISVIVPVRNEEPHMPDTLDQLLELDRENLAVEIIVVDGCSTDRTPEIVTEYAQRHPEIRLCHNPHRLSSAARNIGILESTGDYVVVIDGHCEIPTPDYLHHLVDAFQRTGADCLGRPQPLFARDATFLQHTIAIGRSSWLGHHPASFIYSSQEQDVPALSVAVAYRRTIFDEVGLFDERFDACEDCELNYRIDKAGLHCRFVPQLAVIYKPRDSLRGLFRQLARYGAGRVRLSIKHPETFSIASCSPPAFGLGVVAGAIVCSFMPILWPCYLAVLAIVMLVVFGTSVFLASRERSIRMLGLLPLVFSIIHSSYAWGFLSELFNVRRALRIRAGNGRARTQSKKISAVAAPAQSTAQNLPPETREKGG